MFLPFALKILKIRDSFTQPFSKPFKKLLKKKGENLELKCVGKFGDPDPKDG